jgi:DNA-binding transcriptional ArsR family regulator
MADDVTINILKALADPTRLDIVRKLRCDEGSSPCSVVSTCSSLSQPAMSHHFTKLVEAGVVLEHKTGREKSYELNTDHLKAHGIDVQAI